MAKKPLQFHVPDAVRDEIERMAQTREVTLSEFMRQSVRIYMILSNYTSQGYSLVLRKDDKPEKEIILP